MTNGHVYGTVRVIDDEGNVLEEGDGPLDEVSVSFRPSNLLLYASGEVTVEFDVERIEVKHD